MTHETISLDGLIHYFSLIFFHIWDSSMLHLSNLLRFLFKITLACAQLMIVERHSFFKYFSHIAKLYTLCYMFIPFVSPFEFIPIFGVKLSYTSLANTHIAILKPSLWSLTSFCFMVSFGDNCGRFGMLGTVNVVKFDWFFRLIWIVYMYWFVIVVLLCLMI